jgi:hypothetical protein
MAHINLAEGVPGIRGPMLISPGTTTPLRELAASAASRAQHTHRG